MNTKVVMCDDFTGAMEAGLQIYKHGYIVHVIPDYHFFEHNNPKVDMYVVNTESRNICASDAATRISEALQTISQTKSPIIYKKIDSTMRGNIGSELEAIINKTGIEMIILAPSLPFNGRTTKDGFHYLNGKKLTESDLAKDPFSPIEDSFIPDIIRKQTSLESRVVLLKDIRKGTDFLAELIRKIHAEGCKIAVIDSETENDLEIVSDAVAKTRLKLLSCGSAALFSKIMGQSGNPVSCINHHKKKNLSKPVFVLSGSPASVSKTQIKYAAANGVHLIKLDLQKIKSQLNNKEFAGKVIAETIKNLQQGISVVIDGAGNGKSEIAAQYYNNREALISDSEQIQFSLSHIFKKIIAASDISGAMIIGGDTLYAACKKMSVRAIRITGEVEPFVPAGVMILNGIERLSVVSKAGGFGGEDIIVKAIRHIQNN